MSHVFECRRKRMPTCVLSTSRLSTRNKREKGQRHVQRKRNLSAIGKDHVTLFFLTGLDAITGWTSSQPQAVLTTLLPLLRTNKNSRSNVQSLMGEKQFILRKVFLRQRTRFPHLCAKTVVFWVPPHVVSMRSCRLRNFCLFLISCGSVLWERTPSWLTLFSVRIK